MSRNRMLPLLALAALSCGGTGAAGDLGNADAWVPGEILPIDIGGPDPGLPACEIVGAVPDSVGRLGCLADFLAIASRPLDASIPGARSLKTIVDRADGDRLHYLNANTYPWHFDFARDHLSGNGLPMVVDRTLFNTTEYLSPYRRFLLGMVTRYDEAGFWTYEMEPWDSASADMIASAYRQVRDSTFFGADLHFHPTSDTQAEAVAALPPDVKVVTTEQLFAGISFLPMNPGSAVGQLRFYQVADLESGAALAGPRDVAVLDRVPNDISVTAAIITAAFQTPLSHVNVLSQNRGTPNMVLAGATTREELRALENTWVRLTVGEFDWEVSAVTKEEADAWWETHKPPSVAVPELDLTEMDLADVQDLTLEDIPAYGGKASNYGVLANITTGGVNVPRAFAVPVGWYDAFMRANGLDAVLAGLLADPAFLGDASVREAKLSDLRTKILAAPLDPAFETLVREKFATADYGATTRFRSSTNAEDLDGFTGAGLYESATYDPKDASKSIAAAVRKVYASLWGFRAFEERSWRGIPQTAVGMALLVHRGFPAEQANGVALTNNLFNPEQPAFYVNVQKGDESVVRPEAGVTTDQILYYFFNEGHPQVFLGHSSLVPAGETVLTTAQMFALGQALDAIHKAFRKFYEKSGKFYAMDVEFKFNVEAGDPAARLWIKQARPHPGWTQ